MARLSERAIAAIKPTNSRQQIADDNCKGLYLTVQSTGKKSWSVRYRVSGIQRRLKLGDYPVIGLSEAREKARKAMADTQEGKDPQATKVAARADTVETVAAEFARFHLSKLKSGDEAMGFLRRSILKEWPHRPVRSITKRDISRLILSIAESGRDVTANRTLAHVAKFFSWAAEHGYVDAPPTFGMKMPAKEKPRDRVLTDTEIKIFWQACDAVGYPWGHLGKMLLLTGQRRGEVAGMTDNEIEGDVWHLPAERSKNALPHDVPLSDEALAVLSSIPRIGDYLFTTTGRVPISGFTKGRAKIADKMADIAGTDIPAWTWHDLRRTVETGMAPLGVPESIVSRVMNHVSDQPRMAKTYNHYDYLPEKRDALQKWAKKVVSD